MSKGINLSDLKCEHLDINLDRYVEFRDCVKESINYPEWLGDFTKEELSDMLKNNCKIWIYYLNEMPVCSMMFIPSSEKTITKFELKLNYKVVASYGPMFVSPKFLGNGLQYQMLKELDDFSIKNNYEYAIATIHPSNIYSVVNLLKNDFKVVSQKEFKRGIRNIYFKKLN